jgi:hypothetical protein
VDELVHGHELDGRHAQGLEVRDHRRMADARVRAAELLGHLGVRHGQPLHVGLVDHRLAEGGPRLLVAGPVEARVDDHALRHRGRAVRVVPFVRLAEDVREHRLAPGHSALDRPGVRVQEELVPVAAEPLRWLPWAVDPEAVALPRADAGQEGVPAEAVHLRERDPRLLAVLREEAQLDPLRRLREEGEVRALARPRRPERVGVPRPDLHKVPSSSASACASLGAVRPVCTTWRDGESYGAADGPARLGRARCTPRSGGNPARGAPGRGRLRGLSRSRGRIRPRFRRRAGAPRPPLGLARPPPR